MKINTRNLGEIEVQEDKVITFPEGIPGLNQLTRFLFLESENEALFYLQSIEDTDICFIMADPYKFMEDYAPTINESYFEKLGGGDSDEFAIYVTMCVGTPISESTLNLAGPFLVHIENRLGVQVITEGKQYKTKHKILNLK